MPFHRATSVERSPWACYAIAVMAVVLGYLARWGLTPGVGPTALPFIFFFPAIAIAGWYGGFGPGLLATVLSALAANWFFIEPVHTLAIRSLYDFEALLAFCLASLLIVTALGSMHRNQARLVRAEKEAANARDLLATTVASIGDAVMVTDPKGHITFLNPEAERLTGWKDAEARGQPMANVFRIINEKTRLPADNPVEKVIQTGKITGLANHTILIAKDGTEVPIDDSAAPIREPDGPLFGVVLVFRDVTEQRRAHEANERLASIVEHSGDVMLTKSLDGIIRSWNASAQRLFGYTAEEIVGKPVTTLFPPDRLNEEDHILARLRKGQYVERLETIRVAKDGRRIPVAVSISPLRNADGELIGASKVIHDITDLVAAREALMREKELLATTLASIGDAVIVTDAQGRITFLNAEAERLTKWNCAEAGGEMLPKIFRIINEQSREPVENPVEKVFRLGGVVGLANHTILIARDGAEIPIDDSAAPIRQKDGPLLGVVLVFRDFTERKEAEKALRDLSLFPTQNPAPILRVSRDGTLLYANPAALKDLADLNLAVSHRTPVEVCSFVKEALKTARPTEREMTVGSRTFLVSTAPIRELDYANIYWTDVTERNRAEEALREAHEQLSQRAVQLENTVQQRTKHLQETVESLESFCYSIAHDLRAPVRTMQSFSTILLEDFASKLDEVGKDYARRIAGGAVRLDELIEALLSYGYVSRMRIPKAPIDLENLLQRILADLSDSVAAKKAVVEIERPLPANLVTNEILLEQILRNLLSNALKFIPEGRTPQIDVFGESSNGAVRLAVRDNGIGISAEHQARLFRPFERIQTAQEFPGIGIGLAIVKKAVERLGGVVRVKSIPGQGTEFWIELPVVEK